MGRKTPSAKSKANEAARTAMASAAETLLQQQVMDHYSKTVKFNDMWKSFLSKMFLLVLFMTGTSLIRRRDNEHGVGAATAFEIVSVVIAVATLVFLRRWIRPLFAFKVAFVLVLLQGVWYGTSLYHIHVLDDRQYGDVEGDQLPFGTMFFVVCWTADRFMLHAETTAHETAVELDAFVHKKQ